MAAAALIVQLSTKKDASGSKSPPRLSLKWSKRSLGCSGLPQSASASTSEPCRKFALLPWKLPAKCHLQIRFASRSRLPATSQSIPWAHCMYRQFADLFLRMREKSEARGQLESQFVFGAKEPAAKKRRRPVNQFSASIWSAHRMAVAKHFSNRLPSNPRDRANSSH